jgi:hypothetical protein
MTLFNPVSSSRTMLPVPEALGGALPSEPVHRSAAAVDSLESLAPDANARDWRPERPVLTPPDALPRRTSSEYRFLAATDAVRGVGNSILDTLGTRLENLKHKIKEISAAHIQKLKEAAKRASASGFWAMLKKIATCLLSAISIVFGISLVATGGGALIGGAMIASGILSLSNFAMSETGAWDWICEQLAADNEERQKMLSWILPGAVGVIAGGIGIVGSVQGIASGAIQFTEKLMSVAQGALAIFTGMTTIGKGFADARRLWTQSDLDQIQSDLTVERTRFDSVMREIEVSMSDFRIIKSKSKKIIEVLSQSNVQLVRET